MTAAASTADAGDDTPALRDHRRDIDRIDRTILALVAERVRIGLAVAPIKRAAGLPLRSPDREAEILRRVRDEAERAGRHLPSGSAERIFRVIIDETVAAQEQDR